MERPTPNVDSAEQPEPEKPVEPEATPDPAFTDDEIESMTQWTDAAMRAILGRC